MTTRGTRARRVAVPNDEPMLEGSGFGYVDAFEVDLLEGDHRTAEEFARSCLEDAPLHLQRLVWNAHRHLLRFRLSPRGARGHVLGWRIGVAEADAARLEVCGPLVDGVIVGRRFPENTVRVVTAVRYNKPLAALVMAAIGPVHRRVAPRLLERAVETARRMPPR